MKTNRIILMIVSILLISIIIFILTYRSQQSSQNKWPLDWASGNPCQAPCWEGIYPGTTKLQQVKEILDKNRLFRNYSYENTMYINYELIKWEQQGSSGTTGFAIYHDKISHIVSFIEVFSHYYITFGKVLEFYGEPTNIMAIAGKETDLNLFTYDLSLIYGTKGLLLVTDRSYSPNIPLINKEMKFNLVFFYKPGQKEIEEILNYMFPNKRKYLQEWKGYLGFKEYCQELVKDSCPK